jgi:hypothetical protein
MKRYSTIMSVLLTLALPIAGTCADAPKAADKADSSVEAIKASMSKSKHGGMGGTIPAAGSADLTPSGKVVETMNGGGYTYANLEKDGKKTWVAFTGQETKVGETLTFSGCMKMTDFQSTALKRKFDSILFCNEPLKPNAPAKVAAQKKSPGSTGAVPTAGKVKVDKAVGANGYTVAEIFAKSAALNGKQVVVKGQVMKVASGIMDRTWIHLQDGSGSEKKKNHDLVVTSKDTPQIGEVVTVSGTLAKDKDFGSGYKYDVIIEKGSVKK